MQPSASSSSSSSLWQEEDSPRVRWLKKQLSVNVCSSMTVSEYVSSYLRALGVDSIFTVPGDYSMAMLDSLSGSPQAKLTPATQLATPTAASTSLSPSSTSLPAMPSESSSSSSSSSSCFSFSSTPATPVSESGWKRGEEMEGGKESERMEMMMTRTLRVVACCNELNAGYAADGYSRCRGMACLVVTHGVGALAAINAVAGMYAERIPCIVINASPTTDSVQQGDLLHHTLMSSERHGFIPCVFQQVTCDVVCLTASNLSNTPALIHRAFNSALVHSQPVLIDIPCNLADRQIHCSHAALQTPTTLSTRPRFFADIPPPSASASLSASDSASTTTTILTTTTTITTTSSLSSTTAAVDVAAVPILSCLLRQPSDPTSISAAVQRTVHLLNRAENPMVIVGSLVRFINLQDVDFVARLSAPIVAELDARAIATHTHPVVRFIEAVNLPAATTADAKSLVPDDHPCCIGVYFGGASIRSGMVQCSGAGAAVIKTVEQADLIMLVGTLMSDYSGAASSLEEQVKLDQFIVVSRNAVQIQGDTYHCINMRDFLTALANHASLRSHNFVAPDKLHARVPAPSVTAVTPTGATHSIPIDYVSKATKMKIDSLTERFPIQFGPHHALTTRTITKSLQHFINMQSPSNIFHVLADVGNSWFHALKLYLPSGSSCHLQVNYCSLGVAVGWMLGFSIALQHLDARFHSILAPPLTDMPSNQPRPSTSSPPTNRLIVIAGDGAFQTGGQEVASLIKYQLNPIILIINNASYAIEEAIHPGLYNKLSEWNYCQLVDALRDDKKENNRPPLCYRVTQLHELLHALQYAFDHPHQLAFIDCHVAPQDVHEELIIFSDPMSRNMHRKMPTYL